MQHSLNQATHNQFFHDQLVDKFPDQFFDWKITALFYVAIHLLKALAAKNKVNIGNTHEEIRFNIKTPRSGQRPLMPISDSAYNLYNGLYNYSRTARYEGIGDPAVFDELKQVDHQASLRLLTNFRLYVKERGLAES